MGLSSFMLRFRRGAFPVIIVVAAYLVPMLGFSSEESQNPSPQSMALGVDCQNLKTKEAYCQDYEEVASLRQDAVVQRAKLKCEAFYHQIISASQLICEYRNSLEAKAASFGQLHGQNVNGQSDSFSAQLATIQNIRQELNSIWERSVNGAEQIRVTYEESKGKINEIARDAAALLKEEIHCQKQGRPGRAPSFILAGLAAAATVDQERTARNLRAAMQFLAEDVNLARRELNRLEHRTRNAGNNLNSSLRESVGGERAGLSMALAGLSLGAVDDPVAAAAQRSAQAGAQRATLGAPVPKPIAAPTAPGWAPRLASFVVARGGAMSASTAGGLLPRLIFGGSVDSLAMASVGVNVLAAAAGVTFSTAAAVGVGLAILEARIRNDLGRLERTITEPYIRWARGIVRDSPSLDSGLLAQRYALIKQSLPYCGTCGSRYLATNTNLNRPAAQRECPAHNPFNDKWLDLSSQWGTSQSPNRVPGREINTP
jgi:hypothetical protein